MNALNEAVVAQLGAAFRAAAARSAVAGIVIAGSGKAFVAGADIRFFVKHIEAKNIREIAEFTRDGQELLLDIQTLPQAGRRARARPCARRRRRAGARLPTTSWPRRRRRSRFPKPASASIPGSAARSARRARVGRGLAKWLVLTGETRHRASRRWRSASSTRRAARRARRRDPRVRREGTGDGADAARRPGGVRRRRVALRYRRRRVAARVGEAPRLQGAGRAASRVRIDRPR